MGKLHNIATPIHRSSSRDYLGRMNGDKPHCMKVAREYEFDYWDGDRCYGYGGYRYIPEHWAPAARQLIDIYDLDNNSSVLDVGCGKGYLLYEMKILLPNLTVAGFDISHHGLENAKPEIKQSLFSHKAETPYPFEKDQFDLVISLSCLHNLKLFELEIALREIERVGRSGYLMVESYRNSTELFNLQCWALTAESFLNPEEWSWVYKRCGYFGDHEFIYFE